ncbi:hypothetical protein [Mycobacterium sp. 852013-50091_SCH5140682]|nr:hypothetical protein [Mycobacterium sp. 852013-50091_SCH5140682]
MPCQLCGVDVAIELVADGENYRAPDLLLAMNGHIVNQHEKAITGT